jgi:hypothetical protein
MAQAPITAKIHQPLDVHCNLTAKIAFDDKPANLLTQSLDVLFAQSFHLRRRRHVRVLTDLSSSRPSDSVDRRERDNDVLVLWDVDAGNSCHLHILQLRGDGGKIFNYTMPRGIDKPISLGVVYDGHLCR